MTDEFDEVSVKYSDLVSWTETLQSHVKRHVEQGTEMGPALVSQRIKDYFNSYKMLPHEIILIYSNYYDSEYGKHIEALTTDYPDRKIYKHGNRVMIHIFEDKMKDMTAVNRADLRKYLIHKHQALNTSGYKERYIQLEYAPELKKGRTKWNGKEKDIK